MIRVPDRLWRKFDEYLADAGVPGQEHRAYRKWLRYYLDFCSKYRHAYGEASSVPLFLAKLKSKRQGPAAREQAAKSVAIYQRMVRDADRERREARPKPVKGEGRSNTERPTSNVEVGEERPSRGRGSERYETETIQPSTIDPSNHPVAGGGEGLAVAEGDSTYGVTPREQATGTSWVGEFSELRDGLQRRNYSPRTLKTYTHWVRRFQAFTQSKEPQSLSVEDVKAFLTDLAVSQGVSASTQNQAFNSLLYFFRHVLGREFGKVDGVVRAKYRRYIPVVLSREEVQTVINRLQPPFDLAVLIMYGCGLRISECLNLRVGCFNCDAGILTVHDGKGQKDRTVPLPVSIMGAVRERFEQLAALHREDLAREYSGVFLPSQLEKKYKNAPKEFVWQWFFPAPKLTVVEKTGELRRYHMQPSPVSQAIKQAVRQSAIPKRVSAHTFRHSFASHLLQANYDIRTIQELLGHSDVRTTMIYTHTVPSRTLKERRSPLDL